MKKILICLTLFGVAASITIANKNDLENALVESDRLLKVCEHAIQTAQPCYDEVEHLQQKIKQLQKEVTMLQASLQDKMKAESDCLTNYVQFQDVVAQLMHTNDQLTKRLQEQTLLLERAGGKT